LEKAWPGSQLQNAGIEHIVPLFEASAGGDERTPGARDVRIVAGERDRR
jgi:hypothetical protein